MTRVLRILAALAVLATMLGAENSGCDNQPRRPPKPKTTANPATHTVQIRAHSKGPYHVMLIATDPKTGGLKRRYGPEDVAGGEYRQQIGYESGEVVGIQILVWGNIADTMRCSITDGPKVVSETKPREVLCVLHTSR